MRLHLRRTVLRLVVPVACACAVQQKRCKTNVKEPSSIIFRPALPRPDRHFAALRRDWMPPHDTTLAARRTTEGLHDISYEVPLCLWPWIPTTHGDRPIPFWLGFQLLRCKFRFPVIGYYSKPLKGIVRRHSWASGALPTNEHIENILRITAYQLHATV